MGSEWGKFIERACGDIHVMLDTPYDELRQKQWQVLDERLGFFDRVSSGVEETGAYSRAFERVSTRTKLPKRDFKKQLLIQDCVVLPFSCNRSDILEDNGIQMEARAKGGRIMPDISGTRKEVQFEFIRIEKDDFRLLSEEEKVKTNQRLQSSLLNVPFVFIRDDILEVANGDPEHELIQGYRDLFSLFNHDYLHYCVSYYFTGISESIESSKIKFSGKHGEFSDPLSRESFFLRAHAQYLETRQDLLAECTDSFIGAIDKAVQEKRTSGGSAHECHKIVSDWGGLIGSMYMSSMSVDDPRMDALLDRLVAIDPAPHYVWNDLDAKLRNGQEVLYGDPYEMVSFVVDEVHRSSKGGSKPSQIALRNYFQNGDAILQDDAAGFGVREAMRYKLVRENAGYAYIYSPGEKDTRVASGGERVESIIKQLAVHIDV